VHSGSPHRGNAAVSLRIVYAGTPEFAAAALRALLAHGHEVAGVLTQPDRPAGRGMKLQASPVKQVALEAGIPVWQPRSLKRDGRYPDDAAEAAAALTAAAPDVMVVAAYGLILPAWVLTLPPLGCINIHASLLPRWRGAAPIHRAIEAGDAQTGITLMQMDEGLDTGDMLVMSALDILPEDTTATLHDRLAELGAGMIVEAMGKLRDGRTLQARPQPAGGVTYAHKIEKAEGALDWSQPADVLDRRVRAFDPFPGATAMVGGTAIKVWQARAVPLAAPAVPGTVLAADERGLLVACADASALRLQVVQKPGGRRMPAGPWAQGVSDLIGQPLA